MVTLLLWQTVTFFAAVLVLARARTGRTAPLQASRGFRPARFHRWRRTRAPHPGRRRASARDVCSMFVVPCVPSLSDHRPGYRSLSPVRERETLDSGIVGRRLRPCQARGRAGSAYVPARARARARPRSRRRRARTTRPTTPGSSAVACRRSRRPASSRPCRELGLSEELPRLGGPRREAPRPVGLPPRRGASPRSRASCAAAGGAVADVRDHRHHAERRRPRRAARPSPRRRARRASPTLPRRTSATPRKTVQSVTAGSSQSQSRTAWASRAT